MPISNENVTPHNAINLTSTTPSNEINTKELKTQNTVAQSNNVEKNELSLSFEGKLTQNIDDISNNIDDILLKHVTPEQKEKLDNIYKTLDTLFEKDNLTNKEEKSAEALFEQVHVILESSVNKLSKTEYDEVEKLANKMDSLTSQLENSEQGGFDKDNSSAQLEGALDSQADFLDNEKKSNKKALTVAQLNALSVIELNKLPTNQLKKLNSKQLNKLNSAQLNQLAISQLKQLTVSNVDKLNQSQTNKLSTV